MPEETFNVAPMPAQNNDKPVMSDAGGSGGAGGNGAVPVPGGMASKSGIGKGDFAKDGAKKNKLMPVVIILAVLAVAGVIFGGVGLAQSFAKQDRIEVLEAKIGELSSADGNEVEEKPGTDGEEKPEEGVNRAEVLAEVPRLLAFNGKKCLNCEIESEYTASSSFSGNNGDLFVASLGLGGGSASFRVNWDNLKVSNAYDLDWTDKSGWGEYSDLGLSGRATDVVIAGFGQAFGYETVLFLMEDGGVEYMPIYKALKENNVKSYGKLEGVSEIIKFYQGNALAKNAMVGGGWQTLAQRADGDYYELYDVVRRAGGFDGIF